MSDLTNRMQELAGLKHRIIAEHKKEAIAVPTPLQEAEKDDGAGKTYKLGLVEVHDLKDQQGFVFVIESEGTYEKKNGAVILANFLGLSLHDEEPKKVGHGYVTWDGESIHFAKHPEDISRQKEVSAKAAKED